MVAVVVLQGADLPTGGGTGTINPPSDPVKWAKYWSPVYTYPVAYLVEYKGRNWLSLAVNINTPPDRDAAVWRLMGPALEQEVFLLPFTHVLDANTNYRLTANFSETGEFDLPFFRTYLTDVVGTVTITPEENQKRRGRASWIVFQPGSYSYFANVTFNAVLFGTGWSGSITQDVPATWSISQIA